MAGRRTNLALLGLLSAALATGALAFGLGRGPVRWVAAVHGIAGLALLALAPWKSAIARRSLRRRRPGAWASVAFVGLVVVTLLTGILHAWGLVAIPGGPATLQVHVASALASIPFGLWHVTARRARPRRTDLSRRTLIRTGALLGGAGLAYAVTEGAMAAASLPGAGRRATGSYETGSFQPEEMPVTQWLYDRVPTVDPSAWRLSVRSGSGGREWTYAELGRFDDRFRATLDCTGGWFAHQDWEGVRLDRLLPAGAEARSVVVRSFTGYSRRFPFRDLPRLLLATRAGGEPLSRGHGFPARIVAPGRRGFWWVKWVAAVETSRVPWWWQAPFPLT